MKRLIVIILAVLFLALPLQSEEMTGFGLGPYLGSPTGLNMKLFMNGSNAIDAGIGVAGGTYMYGDYQRHLPGALNVDHLSLYVSGGIGFLMRDEEEKQGTADEDAIEFRMGLGIEWRLKKAPIGIFLEAVPSLVLIPEVDFEARGGLGARYYF